MRLCQFQLDLWTELFFLLVGERFMGALFLGEFEQLDGLIE